MKIVCIARTLNEERYIGPFCKAYGFCDLILIADGGSDDRTVDIARTFANVKIRRFEGRVNLPDGSFMNPEPAHVNFLLDWAEQEHAPDWLVMDGVDCWPNHHLQRAARSLLEQAVQQDKDAALAYRLYLWGENEYLPKINEPGPALWAWRPDRIDCHTDESYTTFFDAVFPGPEPGRAYAITPPAVCLHHWEPESKACRYAAWGHPQTAIPGGIYWPPAPLPEWARE